MDDTYKFMEDHNQNYIESNLVDNTYNELGLNFSFFIDSEEKPFTKNN